MTHRRESLEQIRLRTASQIRKNDQNNIIDTLNIASVPIQQHHTDDKKDEAKIHFKSLVARKLSISRPRASLHGLNFNSPPQSPEERSIFKWPSLKLKCLFRPKITDSKPTVLVLSVNFILNEHYYW
jgi:hypothetical protein